MMSSPQETELIDALVLPFARPMHPKFSGGLVLPEHGPLQALRHQRWNRPVDHPLPTQTGVNHRLAGRHRYGGPLMLPFGHFMAESIHRLLPLHPGDAELPVVFAGLRGADTPALPAFAREVLALLGVDSSRLQVLTRPTVIDRLVVRAQGSNLGGGPSSEHLDALDRLATWQRGAEGEGQSPSARLYVSRSAQVRGSLLGEQVLEAAMAANGFAIFKPEEHSVAQQMRAYTRAEVVVFAEGSACHGVELLGRSLKTVVLINRRGARNMDMFAAILRPRAARYLEFRRNVFVGALPANRTGQPQPHQGVSVLALKELTAFMGDSGIADLSNLRLGDYLHAIRDDFSRYTQWAVEQGFGDRAQMHQLAGELWTAVQRTCAKLGLPTGDTWEAQGHE